MKRITILIIALFALSTITAQQVQQRNSEEFSKYFENTVKPEIEKQQKEFLAKLSKTEKQNIESLSQKADEILKQAEEKLTPEYRIGFREEMMTLRDQANKIAKAHPEQSEKYRLTMIKNIEKWKAEMPLINNSRGNRQGYGQSNGQSNGQGNGQGNRQGNTQGNRQSNGQGNGQGNRGGQNMNNQQNNGMYIFQQMSDPAWLLLWNSERTNQMMTYAGQRSRIGNWDITFRNPELKTELQDYAQNNILPEIVEKRKLFDEKLSTEEKAKIEQAKGMVATRNAMQESYMESEDFEAGSRRDDPNFDAFRSSMQQNMQEIRAISFKHTTEITEIINSLKPQYDKWLDDLEKIVGKYENDKFVAGEMLSKSFEQNTNPMGFIIFDTKNPEFWTKTRGGPVNSMQGNNYGNRNRY